MKKLFSILVLTFFFTGCSDSADSNAATPSASVDIVELKVEEMDCGSCIRKIKKALHQFPGVKSVKANVDTKIVKIEVSDKKLFNLEKTEAKVYDTICSDEKSEATEAAQ